MKKTTFTKMLALAIGVIIIVASLTVGFGTFAAAPADSEASYYNENDKGIRATLVEYPYQLKPVEQISNLNFEDGFRFWAGGKGKGTYGDTAFDIETDGGNSYAKIPTTGYVSNFQTALLKLNNVTTGDKIVIVYDVKGTDGNKIRIKAEQEFVKSIAVYDESTGLNTTKKADGVNLINVTPGVPEVIVNTGVASSNFATNLTDGWTTLVSPSNKALVAPSTGSAHTADPIADAYYIKLTVTCGDAGVSAGDIIDAAVDNIRIAKVANGVYTDVVTNTTIYDPNANQGGDDDNQGGGSISSKYPAYYGTEADGFSSLYSSYPVALKPYDTITNLDFTDGFIFWSGQKVENATNDTKVLASDNFQIKQEANGNKYLTLRDDGFAFSIRTTFFKVANAKVGDKVVLIYDAKGADATSLRPFLMQDGLRPVTYQADTGLNTNTPHPTNAGQNWNASAGSPKTIVGSALAPSEFATNLAPAGWTTYVTISATTIAAPADITSSATDDIYLQVCVGRDETAGNTFDAAIDNIRVAKVENGVYTDLATGAVIYDPNAPAGGSGSTGTGTGTGTGSSSGTSNATGDSILMLAALFFVSGAGVFGTAKALKNR